MKKTIYLYLVLVVLGIGTANAQSAYSKGDRILNFGLAYDGAFVGVDWAVHPDITVGATAGFIFYNYGDRDGFFPVRFAGNANYHFNSVFGISEKWDLYAGLNLGFRYAFDLGAQIGFRYYWSNFGFNLEAGGGSAFGGDGRIGLSMKF